MKKLDSLIQKADMALADLTTNGGRLNPEQADKFILDVAEQPTIIKQARTVRMNGPEMKINAIGIGQRMLRKGFERTAIPSNKRTSPTTRQVVLNSKLLKGEIVLPYEVLEDNIERGSLQQTILRLVAERCAFDLELLMVLGDTSFVSGDAEEQEYFRTLNGFLKKITSHEVDVAAFGNVAAAYAAGLDALEPKYKRNIGQLKYYVPHNTESQYRLKVGNRQTALGDATLTGDTRAKVMGVSLEPVAALGGTQAILTDPKNLIVGIQRDITIEWDKDIRAQEYFFVVSLRVDCAIEDEKACVQLMNLQDPDSEEP